MPYKSADETYGRTDRQTDRQRYLSHHALPTNNTHKF